MLCVLWCKLFYVEQALCNQMRSNAYKGDEESGKKTKTRNTSKHQVQAKQGNQTKQINVDSPPSTTAMTQHSLKQQSLSNHSNQKCQNQKSMWVSSYLKSQDASNKAVVFYSNIWKTKMLHVKSSGDSMRYVQNCYENKIYLDQLIVLRELPVPLSVTGIQILIFFWVHRKSDPNFD